MGIQLHSYEIVDQQSEDGPWLCRVPLVMVAKLAELQEPKLDQVARAWWTIEEFQPRGSWDTGWEIAEVKGHLIELVTLAKRSTVEGKSLYMWICL